MKTFQAVAIVMEFLHEECDFEDEFVHWWADVEAGEIRCCINCNDLFWWATADSEYLEPEGVPLFRKAWRDVQQFGLPPWEWAPLLFAAWSRGMRPQGAYYDHIPQVLWPLFDAAGPSRADETHPCYTSHPEDRSALARFKRFFRK